jgi:hypothetical protein
MLRRWESNCSFVFVRSLVRSFVDPFGGGGEGGGGGMTREMTRKKQSDDEGKKKQRKGLMERAILIGIIETPPNLGLGLRMRNGSTMQTRFHHWDDPMVGI